MRGVGLSTVRLDSVFSPRSIQPMKKEMSISEDRADVRVNGQDITKISIEIEWYLGICTFVFS